MQRVCSFFILFIFFFHCLTAFGEETIPQETVQGAENFAEKFKERLRQQQKNKKENSKKTLKKKRKTATQKTISTPPPHQPPKRNPDRSASEQAPASHQRQIGPEGTAHLVGGATFGSHSRYKGTLDIHTGIGVQSGSHLFGMLLGYTKNSEASTLPDMRAVYLSGLFNRDFPLPITDIGLTVTIEPTLTFRTIGVTDKSNLFGMRGSIGILYLGSIQLLLHGGVDGIEFGPKDDEVQASGYHSSGTFGLTLRFITGAL
jgi:hypothetical protein